MRLFVARWWVITIILTGLLYSCQKELYFDQEPEPGQLNNHWEFTESARFLAGSMDSTIFQILWDAETISFFGTSDEGTGKFSLQISSATPLGTGLYKNNDLLFSYTENGTVDYRNDPVNADDFLVNISYLDSVFVSGTFEGQTKDASGNMKTITKGKFNAKITAKRILSAGSGNGQLVFWSRQGCGSNGTGSIKVSVQNKESTITGFHQAEPACNSTGVASFTLPSGNYSCLAICGADTARIGVTVIEGACTKTEVVFCTFLQTGCKISEDTLFFPPTLTLESKKYSFNAQKQVERMQRLNLHSGDILLDLRISYSGSQVIINQDGLFNLDGCGRVREYIGYDIPGNYQNGKKLFMRFYYDQAGYMERITAADANSPNHVIEELILSWNSGNLTNATFRDLNSVARIEYEWRYDFSKHPKNFVCLLPSNPILYLQSALNYGKNPENLLDHIITKTTDKQGQLFTDTTYFGKYVLDTDNYVKEFNVSGGPTIYYERGSHFLGYKCF
jgi:hypothetical protein